MNQRELDKIELIKNGDYERFLDLKKHQFKNGLIPSDDPKFYLLTEYELELSKCIDKSTKKKKQENRLHAYFMHEFYDNIGFLTLTLSDKCIKYKYESIRQIASRILDACFDDYIGKFEISPKGRLHGHFITAWNGHCETFIAKRKNTKGIRTTYTMVKKQDLQDLRYGSNKTKQPSKYGIYDLIYIDKDNLELKKISNYSLKSLNTMESYITKNDELTFNNLVDEDLIIQVNKSNIMTKRNTPYQNWKKARKEQDNLIKRKARTFDTYFYDKNKYNSKEVFRQRAKDNSKEKLTDYLMLFEDDFKLIEIDDYK